MITYAGRRDHVELVEPYFECLSKKTMYMGEDPGRASLMKNTGNVLQGLMIEALAESLTFSELSGLGVDEYMKFISLMFPNSNFEAITRRMHAGLYHPACGQVKGSDIVYSYRYTSSMVSIAD